MQTPYEKIGGEDVVRKLVDRFYDLMDQEQSFHGIRELHAKNLKASRDKLFMFLSGWLGGPQLYVEKYGHPRLRQRHLPFAIGESERDQWLTYMTQAMEDVGLEEDMREELKRSFWKTADFMRNQEG